MRHVDRHQCSSGIGRLAWHVERVQVASKSGNCPLGVFVLVLSCRRTRDFIYFQLWITPNALFRPPINCLEALVRASLQGTGTRWPSDKVVYLSLSSHTTPSQFSWPSIRKLYSRRFHGSVVLTPPTVRSTRSSPFVQYSLMSWHAGTRGLL